MGSVLIVAAVALMLLVATGVVGDGTRGNSDSLTSTSFGEPIQTPTEGPPPTPSPNFLPGSDASIARLVIPSIDIDAAVVVIGVEPDGLMQSPNNGYDTGWYDFSARPGFGGNAVFSGHVDYYDIGPAVFWRLKDLEPGDVIEIHLEDGTIYRYATTSRHAYHADTAPVAEIVGHTPVETVTLITCTGTFNSATRQYDQRLVVRAERIPDLPDAPDLPST